MPRLSILLLTATLLPAQTIVLQHANVIDGVSAQPQLAMTITVRDGRIDSVQAGARECAG